MKTLNIILLFVGVMLLAGGHLGWWLVREPERASRSAQFLLLVVPGWALVAMGYLGLLVASKTHA